MAPANAASTRIASGASSSMAAFDGLGLLGDGSDEHRLHTLPELAEDPGAVVVVRLEFAVVVVGNAAERPVHGAKASTAFRKREPVSIVTRCPCATRRRAMTKGEPRGPGSGWHTAGTWTWGSKPYRVGSTSRDAVLPCRPKLSMESEASEPPVPRQRRAVGAGREVRAGTVSAQSARRLNVPPDPGMPRSAPTLYQCSDVEPPRRKEENVGISYVEFEDEAGVLRRYRKHVNGRGLVATTAKVDPTAFVDPTAYVDPGAEVQRGAQIGPGGWVGRDAIVAERAVVGVNAHIGPPRGRRPQRRRRRRMPPSAAEARVAERRSRAARGDLSPTVTSSARRPTTCAGSASPPERGPAGRRRRSSKQTDGCPGRSARGVRHVCACRGPASAVTLGQSSSLEPSSPEPPSSSPVTSMTPKLASSVTSTDSPVSRRTSTS